MLQPANTNPPPASSDDPVTFDEFCRVVHDGQKADLIDGVIYMASPDTMDANDLNGFLWSILRMYDGAKQLGGLALGSRYAIHIDDLNALEPDILYASAERRHLAERLGFNGGPDVAVEIVSRDSRRRDTVVKRDLYERAGVREYWIIDPRETTAEFLQLVDGVYQPIELSADGIFRSQAIPGFWLQVSWLFQSPLPNAYDSLQMILAGPAASRPH